MQTQYLTLSWSVSRGRDTYGYNICRLDANGKRYRAHGGGYDMVGTVFAEWLTDTYAARLLKLKNRAHSVVEDGKYASSDDRNHARTEWIGNGPTKPRVTAGKFYGMTHNRDNRTVRLDGGCGLESMLTIARAIGLDVQSTGNRKGQTTGFVVVDTREVTR